MEAMVLKDIFGRFSLRKNRWGAALVCCALLAAVGCASPEPPPQPEPTVETVSAEPPESVHFQVRYGDSMERINMRYVPEEDRYYVFLPAFASQEDLYSSSPGGVYLMETETLRPASEAAGYIHYPAQTPLLEVGFDQDYAMRLTEGEQGDVITVRFMHGENIPAMFISTESGSMEAVMADQAHKEKASMTLIRADGLAEYTGPLRYIKGRGNTSWTHTSKRSFNIRLEAEADILEMGAGEKWRLIGNGLDPTILRNKLAYDLAAEVGMPYSVDSRFLDLYIDGVYWGVYLLTERVEIGEHRVDIADLESETAAVNLEELENYPMVYLRDEEDGPSTLADYESYSAIPNDPEDITGGYLVECTAFTAKDIRTPVFSTSSGLYFSVINPEHISQKQHAYLSELFDTVDRLIQRGSKNVLRYIDGESWANMAVISELLINRDTMLTSQFFYKDADGPEGDTPIYAGPLWDMDKTLSNGSSPDSPRVMLLMELPWFASLYSIDGFRQQMVEQYKNVFLPQLEMLLDNGIDGYVESLSASAAMDFVAWPREDMDAQYTWRTETLAEGAEELKRFLRERVDFLTDLWVNGGEYHRVRIFFADDSYFVVLHYFLKDGEKVTEAMLDRRGNQVSECLLGTPGSSNVSYDINTPVTGDLDLTVPTVY